MENIMNTAKIIAEAIDDAFGKDKPEDVAELLQSLNETIFSHEDIGITKEEMEAIVQRALYPPKGGRSYGPFHAPFADPDRTSTMVTYQNRAKDIAIIPLIETMKGVENIEDTSPTNTVSAETTSVAEVEVNAKMNSKSRVALNLYYISVDNPITYNFINMNNT